MRLSIPLCWFNRHKPDRDAAWWDGDSFVSHCVDCHAPIRRKAHRRWARDWKQATPPLPQQADPPAR